MKPIDFIYATLCGLLIAAGSSIGFAVNFWFGLAITALFATVSLLLTIRGANL